MLCFELVVGLAAQIWMVGVIGAWAKMAAE